MSYTIAYTNKACNVPKSKPSLQEWLTIWLSPAAFEIDSYQTPCKPLRTRRIGTQLLEAICLALSTNIVLKRRVLLAVAA